MCYAIIRVSFKVAKEPTSYHEVHSREELAEKVEELKGRDGVAKITTFGPVTTVEMVSEWRAKTHAQIN